jgi:hypothetical protein
MTREGNVRDVMFFPGENNFGLLGKMEKFVKEGHKKQTQNFDKKK